MSSCGPDQGPGQRGKLRTDAVTISEVLTVPNAPGSGVGREKEAQTPRSAVDDDGAFALEGRIDQGRRISLKAHAHAQLGAA